MSHVDRAFHHNGWQPVSALNEVGGLGRDPSPRSLTVRTEDGVSAPALSVPPACQEEQQDYGEDGVLCGRRVLTALAHPSAPSPLLRLFCSDTAFTAHHHSFPFPSGTVRKPPGSRSPAPHLWHCCRLSASPRAGDASGSRIAATRSAPSSRRKLPAPAAPSTIPPFLNPSLGFPFLRGREAGRRSDSLLKTYPRSTHL